MNKASAHVSPNADLSIFCASPVNFWLFSGSMSFCLWASIGVSFFLQSWISLEPSPGIHMFLVLYVQLDNFYFWSVWFAILSKLEGCCRLSCTSPSFTSFIYFSLGFTCLTKAYVVFLIPLSFPLDLRLWVSSPWFLTQSSLYHNYSMH